LGNGKKEIQEQASKLFAGKRGPNAADEHSEPKRLYGEIGRLKMELDWPCHERKRKLAVLY
jgi:hypothetical protein